MEEGLEGLGGAFGEVDDAEFLLPILWLGFVRIKAEGARKQRESSCITSFRGLLLYHSGCATEK